MENNNNDRVVAVIREWKSYDYVGIDIVFAVDRGTGKDRYSREDCALNNFKIRCQGGGFSGVTGENKRLYGFSFVYTGNLSCTADIDDIKPIFSKVDHAKKKYIDDYGYIGDFTTYCMVILRALRIDTVVMNDREYTDTRYAIESTVQEVISGL
jgi:hypothetical protein